MKAGVAWLKTLLDPAADLSADQIEALLTAAGFPVDARESVPGGDTRLEVEVTSNRGDCLSHLGLAREIAARTNRTLRATAIPSVRPGAPAAEALKLRNEIPDRCPRFTAHIIRGVTVKPSPPWLVQMLESVGQRAINNIVDVTNYINFLYGQPAHAFDLNKLAGRTLVVRMARDGEKLTTLDGKGRTLKADEMIIADGERAQSLAGIMGGAESEVGPGTRDVVLEAATWDPPTVRRAARHHQIRTDAGHRFERGVDPRTIDEPARLAAAMIADLGGGTLGTGMLDEGSPPRPLRTVTLRTQRCRDLLGVAVPDETIVSLLKALSIEVVRGGPGSLLCTIPAFRLDLEREVDVIEEVARLHGLDRVPMHDRISIAVRPPQRTELTMRRIGDVLSGLGFFETVTYTFVTPRHAAPFLPTGHAAIAVSDDRRTLDGTLRPSTIPSLLLCRKANSDAGVEVEGGVRLFETAAAFSRSGSGLERRTLAAVLAVPGIDKGKTGTAEDRQRGIRLLRGAMEAVAETLGGRLELVASVPRIPAFDPGVHADLLLEGKPAGSLGLLSAETQRLFGLDVPVAAAELDLDLALSLNPSRVKIANLPAFPSIERDLSLIVDEDVTWGSVHTLVAGAGIDRLESAWFIGAFRGKQIGAGKKSLTLRMRFRDPARTLRHEDVDPQVSAVVALAGGKLGATLRV